MIRRTTFQKRSGANAVEFAVICPLLFTLLFGLIIGGLGVFRYQEVASLAREGARYASVHGAQYQKETGNTAATAQDIYQNAILPKVVALDTSRLTYQVTWNTDNGQYHTSLDASNNLVVTTNTVTVTVSYRWIPEAYLGGITLTSTSVLPMTF